MIAVYPGSFDPVTSGHYDIIARAAGMYERVIVLVAVNSSKTPLFDAAERAAMLRESCADLRNVRIEMLPDGLLVEYARARGAGVIGGARISPEPGARIGIGVGPAAS